MMKCRRGGSIVELLVSAVVSLLVGSVTMVAFMDAVQLRAGSERLGSEENTLRFALDGVADRLRNAQLDEAGNSVLASGAVSSIGYFVAVRSNQRIALLRLRGDRLECVVQGSVHTICSGVNGITLTYYKRSWTGDMFETTLNPHEPTALELPDVIAVEIEVRVGEGEAPRTISSFVRLRNNPR